MNTARAVGVAVVILALVAIPLLAETAADKPLPQPKAQVDLELTDVSVNEAISALFKGTGLTYEMSPDITGRIVELKLKGITFTEGLNALTEAAGLTYTIEDGVYKIKKMTTAASGGASAASIGAGPPQSQQVTEPAPAQTQETTAEPAANPNEVPPTNTHVIINNNAPGGPVFYGHPGPAFYDPYGAYFPGVLQFGNVSVISRYPPIVLNPGTRIFTPSAIHPPIPGWVSPEALRFLRNQYVIRIRPGFIY